MEARGAPPAGKELDDMFDNSQDIRELGQAIAYYRKYRGLTQESLAERIGISRSHLAAVEAPNVPEGISVNLIFTIAKALQIDAYMLFQFSKLRPGADQRNE